VKTAPCTDVVEDALVGAEGIDSNFAQAAVGSQRAVWAVDLLPSSGVCIVSDFPAGSAFYLQRAIHEYLPDPCSATYLQ